MGGYLMQLQNYSVNDGDGLRTTVFLAGCPLRCAWCANPEGWSCTAPSVRYVNTEDVLRQIRRQAIFYRFSGGGVTFSGGEATAQPGFLAQLTDALYDEGYDLALETCGAFDFAVLRPTLRKMNLLFVDLKLMDAARHRRFTGVDNGQILQNIQSMAALGVSMVVRIPTILGVNGTDADMEAAFAFLRKNAPRAAVELLPYHRYGEDKYRALGLPLPDAAFGIPTQAQLAAWQALAGSYGLQTVSYR